jgi:hypothetical protein
MINKINEHFGIINQSVIERLGKDYAALKTPEEKDKFLDKAKELMNKNGTLQEFESKLAKGELNITKIDTSNVERDSKTNAIKLKPGYDSPNYYDSLNNVYKQ